MKVSKRKLVKEPTNNRKAINGDKKLPTSKKKSLPPSSQTDKENVTATKKLRKDSYCWQCDLPNATMSCDSCVRSFHPRCLSNTSTFPLTCSECQAANVPWSGPESFDKYAQYIFKLLLKNKTFKGNQVLVSLRRNLPTGYSDIIVNVMDMETIAEKICNKRYPNGRAFLSDFQWIHHNSVIFFGECDQATLAAEKLLSSCKKCVENMEDCPQCYLRMIRKLEGWFTHLCDKPHPVVMARVKGYPTWPCKVLFCDDTSAKCWFFGPHDKATVNFESIQLINKEILFLPTPGQNEGLLKALAEMKNYLENYEKKFGPVKYFTARTTPNKTQLQLLFNTTLTEDPSLSLIPIIKRENGTKTKSILPINGENFLPLLPDDPWNLEENLNSLHGLQSPVETEQEDDNSAANVEVPPPLTLPADGNKENSSPDLQTPVGTEEEVQEDGLSPLTSSADYLNGSPTYSSLTTPSVTSRTPCQTLHGTTENLDPPQQNQQQSTEAVNTGTEVNTEPAVPPSVCDAETSTSEQDLDPSLHSPLQAPPTQTGGRANLEEHLKLPSPPPRQSITKRFELAVMKPMPLSEKEKRAFEIARNILRNVELLLEKEVYTTLEPTDEGEPPSDATAEPTMNSTCPPTLVQSSPSPGQHLTPPDLTQSPHFSRAEQNVTRDDPPANLPSSSEKLQTPVKRKRRPSLKRRLDSLGAVTTRNSAKTLPVVSEEPPLKRFSSRIQSKRQLKSPSAAVNNATSPLPPLLERQDMSPAAGKSSKHLADIADESITPDEAGRFLLPDGRNILEEYKRLQTLLQESEAKREEQKQYYESKLAALQQSNKDANPILNEPRELSELRLEVEHHKKQAEENKKQKWCALCGETARLLCCSSVFYCSYKCQTDHWSQHAGFCSQLTKSLTAQSPSS